MLKGCEELFNKEIQLVHCDDHSLTFNFKDGTKYEFADHAENCCEKRYIHTDDCLNYFKDSKFVNAEVQDGPTTGDVNNYEVNDSQYLIITTTKGQFTIVNHNDHNGYYSGFDLVVTKV
jgi:hypothetical protein